MKWEYYGQSTWKFNKSVSINLNKTGKSTNEVKHDLSSCSNVFTPVSPISKTEMLSGKILPESGILPDTGYLGQVPP